MSAFRPAINPFRTARIDHLPYRLRGATWDDLIARFDDLGRRVAVVGDHGAGKTRFLASFAAQLRDRGRPTWSVRATHAPPPSAAEVDGRIVLVDELDALPWATRWRWRRRLRAAAGVVIARHAPSATLPTLHRCAPDAALVAELVAELVAPQPEAATAPSLEAPTAGDLAALIARHRGNVRAVFAELYDRAAGRDRAATSDAARPIPP